MTRRALGAARMVLAAGLVLAVGTPLAWTSSRPSPDAGVLPTPVTQPRTVIDSWAHRAVAPPLRSAGREEDPRDGAAVDGPGGPAKARPRLATRSARLAALAGLAGQGVTAPTLLAIPDLGVEAQVIAVGVEADGAMQVPADVAEVGWYRYGPAPGEPGVAVLAAHVDSRAQGRGVFFELRRIGVGAEVVVSDDAGAAQRFEVVSRRTYEKAQLPVAELFARTGPPRLALVTCGGDFDPGASSYRGNVVVYAVPVDDPPA